MTAIVGLLAIPLTSLAQTETKDRGTGKGMPMPELLFYEAAEQAVEDGYAEIIPSSESEKKTADTAAEEGKKSEPTAAAVETAKDDTADKAAQ